MFRPLLIATVYLLLGASARADLPRQFAGAQGLPQRSVLDLVQDEHGYLWVATMEGLARFDGRSFTVVGTADEFPCRAVHALALGEPGQLFAGLRDCGVVRVDATGIHQETISSDPGSQQVKTLSWHQGTLFVGTEAGLYRRDSGGYRQVAGLDGRYVHALLSTPSGLMVGTVQGLYRLPSGGQGVEQLLSGGKVTALEADGQGGVWVASKRGVERLNPRGEMLVTHAAPLPVWEIQALRRGQAGELWIGTEQGIWILDGQGRLRALEAAIFPRQWVTSFLSAPSGMWIGTFEQGLYQLRDGGGMLINESNGLERPVAWSIHQDPTGEVWLTGGNGGLYRLQDGRAILEGSSPAGTRLNSVDRDADGVLWVGGVEGLFRLGPKGLERAHYPEARERVRNIIAREGGGLWVTSGTGVHLLTSEGTRSWSTEQLKTGRIIQAISDEERGLYLTVVGGVLRIRADGSVQTYPAPPDLGGLGPIVLRKGRVWVGGGLGLALLDGDRLRRVRSEGGGLERDLVSMVEDLHGGLWAGTNQGVFSLGAASLDRAQRDPTALVKVSYLNEVNGAVPLECNAISADGAIRTRDGRLWFATMEGVLVVDPSKLQATLPLPAPRIEQLTTAAGGRVSVPSQLILPAGTPWWRLDFNLPLPVGAERLQFRYRLVSASRPSSEAAWTEGQHERAALFIQTEPGEYRFELQARLPPGEWSPAATALVTLEPRWYQRRWVQALGVGVLLALISLFSWLRFRRVRRHARWLEASIRERTSELAEALEAATASEANFRCLTEELPVGILLHQGDRLLWANAEAYRISGSPVEPGRSPWSPPPPEAFQAWIEVKAAAAGTQPCEVPLQGQDGVQRTVELRVLPMQFDGSPASLRVAVDTTERRDLDRRLQMSARLASIGTLAAGVAHEMNNPLAFVVSNIGYIRNVLQDLYPDGAPDDLDAVVAETLHGTSRLKRIVADMKAFSRDDTSDSAEPVQLQSVVEFSLRMAQRELAGRARVKTWFQQGLPPVRASEARLGQVFTNLLVNAAQAIDEGSPETNEVSIRVFGLPTGEVGVSVRDTGAGIQPEHLPRLFDPFFTTKPVGSGTGLGLSVSHGIIKELSGEMKVQSTPGRGSTFTVVLPASEAQAGGEPPSRAKADSAAGPALRRAG